jgi:type I restriction enzyme S subunit
MVIGNLPDGWTIENINRVITKIPLTGKKLPQSEYLESGKYPVIDQGQSYIGGYSNNDDLVVPCKLPVIIFGDHTKGIKFVNFPFVAGADGVKVIKPSGVFSPKLFYYFLQAIELPNKGYARHFQYLEKETIPVPPLIEQERIVAKIEELFTQLEAGTAALKRVRAGLKRYKASVLKAACEGKLLENRGIENSDGLPEGWHEVNLKEIAEIVDPQPSHRTPPEFENGIPYVGMGDIDKNGGFDLGKARKVSPEVLNEHHSRYQLREGDFVFGKIGTIGKPFKLHPPFEYALSANVILVQPKSEHVDPSFLFSYMAGPIMEAKLTRDSRATTQAAFGILKARELSIPLPPLAEQRRIVAEVERRLSVAQEVESVLAASVARASRLRQSVLKSAFEGRLTP